MKPISGQLPCGRQPDESCPEVCCLETTSVPFDLAEEIKKRITKCFNCERRWQPIETAPKDGTEVLGYRKDAHIFLMRWTSPESFCTDDELGALGDSGYVESWFYADFVAGGRLEGSEVPTHWMPLPEGPRG